MEERYLVCRDEVYSWSRFKYARYGTGFSETELRERADRGDEWAAYAIYEADLEDTGMHECETV